MSKKKNTAKAEEKQTQKKTTKKPVAGKTATGKNTGSCAGKTATGNKSGSGRTSQSAKRTPTKQEPPKKRVKQDLKADSEKKKSLIQKLISILKKRIEQKQETPKKESNVGKVYRGRTKYIDKETKKERSYVVVLDDGKSVSVAKLKSIKIFDENGRNADKALVEINATRYGLEKRTGVDFQTFDKNRMSGKPLKLEDKDVFPEDKERFKLGSHDTHKALEHTGKIKKQRKRK